MIRCKAVDLIGEYEQLLDISHVIKLGNRSREYHGAYLSLSESICVYRIEPALIDGKDVIRVRRRYIDLDRNVMLIPIAK